MLISTLKRACGVHVHAYVYVSVHVYVQAIAGSQGIAGTGHGEHGAQSKPGI